MIQILATAIISYIVTSIDDLLVSAIFFAQSNSKRDNWHIFLGKYIGTGFLVVLGCLGAFGMSFVPTQYIGVLGFIPIALGVKEFIVSHKKEKQIDKPKTFAILSVTVGMVTLANGADNIGVYISLFAYYKWNELVLICIVFTVMIFTWSFLAKKLTDMPRLRGFIIRNKSIVIPIVYVTLGIYIIVKAFI